MTTLRTFQNEIEDIHNRELSRQRAQALADMEKEQKTSKGKAKVEANTMASPAPTGANGTEAGGFQEMEELILVGRRKLPMCKLQLLILLSRL
jgi:outer membrane protein OmpA-like peptidoglycan-associated protein